MADIKWIKITTDMFDNRKIRQIEALPDGDAIIVIWVKLICLAGSINDGGYVYFTKEIPYTDQTLSTQFNRPLHTIQLALQTFRQFNMIEIVDDILKISNWEKYQNIDGMEKIKEQTRLRVQKHREKQKQIECNVTRNVTVTQSNAIDIDIEEDIDKNKNKKKNINTSASSDKENRSQPSTMPSVIELILNDKSLFPVHQDDIDLWTELYPSVDIMQELRKMKGWLDSNPTKRKTKNGIKRFINSWLSREQDRGYPTQYQDQMPDYMKKQEKGEIVSTPVSDEALAKALELQRQFKGK